MEMEEFDGFPHGGWMGRPDMDMFRMMMRGHHMDRDMRRIMERDRRRRDSDSSEDYRRNREEVIIEEKKDDKIYFEDFLFFPRKLYEKPKKQDNDNDDDMIEVENILTLQDFKKEKINKLKEDIFYYCATPEILNKLSKSIEDEKSYQINQDLNTKNLIFSQKIKNKILNDKETKLKNIIKEKKLSNYNKELPKNLSNLEIDKEEKDKEIENCSLITNKIDDIFFNYKENTEKEIIKDLKELEKLIMENKVTMKCLGFLTYNLLEISLCNLLNSISQKFEQKKSSEDTLKQYLQILLSINKSFKSVKLLIILIQFCDSHNKLLKAINYEQNNFDQLISKDSINFGKLFNEKNIRNKIKVDFTLFWNKDEIKEKIKNLNNTNYSDYLTLHYKDDLFVFLNYKNKETKTNDKEEGKQEQESMQDVLYYLKINILEKNVINYGKIELNKEKEEMIIDINASIKNEFIYLFYLTEKSKKERYLKYKIYNQSTMGLIKQDQIDFKKYQCSKLLNDGKYLYCICKEKDSFKVLIIQKKLKLDFQSYTNLTIYLEKAKFEEKDFTFKMYNGLSINNLLILESSDDKYISQFSMKGRNEYVLNIAKLNNENTNNIDENDLENKNIKLSFNNNRFLLTKIDKNGFIINISQKDNNNLINEGISLLPFDSSDYNNISLSKNLYRDLLQNYSAYLNIYGNFDLLSKETEKFLVEENFIYCFSFKEYILNFLVKKVIENNKEEKLENKLYYLIILKQTICSMYNSGIFQEKKIKNLFDYLKEFIIKNIEKKDNMATFNKILKEIIYILSYVNESGILDIKDVEKYLKNGINKTNFLLIDLLLEQKTTQKKDDLYKILINFDKEYLINIFNKNTEKNKDKIFHHYSLYRHIISKSSEILFISYFNNEEKFRNLIQLIEPLIINMKEIFQKYIESQNNANIISYSFIYNSFNFRLFYFIIQNILSKNIFIENKIQILIQDLLLYLDKNSLKEDLNDFLDLNNLFEVKISSIADINDTQEFGLNENYNLIIKSSYIHGIDINNIINVYAVNIKNENYLIDLTKDSNIIYKGIKKIIINYIKKDSELKNEFVIDFIPVKDEENFIKYKENQDIKMVNLIEKSIILFLFNSYDPIQNLIDNYDKDKLVVNHAKLYQNEIFKYINEINKDYKQDTKSELYVKSEQLIEEIKNILKNEFNEYSIKHQPIDEKKEKENKKINNLIRDLVKYLEIYYSKTKKINYEKTSIKNVKPLINKIFTIGIKYNDLDKKLGKLIEDINVKNINTEDININTQEIESIENFKEIFSLYKASFKMSSIYDIDKNKFFEDEFKKEIKKYQENINIKLDFIDEVISSKT